MTRSSLAVKSMVAAALGASFALVPIAASALVINEITTTAGIEGVLLSKLLAPSSGITVVPGSFIYQGTNTSSLAQSGLYTGFNLAPTSGSTPTLTLADGIVLSSGSAAVPLTNTVNNFSRNTGSGANAALTTLAGGETLDANVLTFDFTVAPGQTSVSAQFVFGTEEFPTQSVTDIFGFFVDGDNYAKFASGELISNTPGNPTNFIANPLGAGLYGIEYNGLTQVFTVTGLLDPTVVGAHTLTIGIADTSDTIFQSGVFLTGLRAGTETGGGIDPTVPVIPEPETYALMLAGLGAVGAVARRRKQRQK